MFMFFNTLELKNLTLKQQYWGYVIVDILRNSDWKLEFTIA